MLRAVAGTIVFAFWAALIHQNWTELSAQRWDVDLPVLFSTSAAFGLYFLGLGLGWTLVARAMGGELPIRHGIVAWLLSMPARYVPGNVWHIAVRTRLASGCGVRPESVVASSTLEQILTVLSAACLAVGWLPSLLGRAEALWIAAFLAACVVALQPPVQRVALMAAGRLLGKPAPSLTLGYRQLALLLGWYGLVNTLNGFAFSYLAGEMSRYSGVGWPLLASAYCLAYVAGYLSFLTPSGIGVKEAVLTSLLATSMPISIAMTLSILARLLSMAGEAMAVAGGALALALYRKRAR